MLVFIEQSSTVGSNLAAGHVSVLLVRRSPEMIEETGVDSDILPHNTHWITVQDSRGMSECAGQVCEVCVLVCLKTGEKKFQRTIPVGASARDRAK